MSASAAHNDQYPEHLTIHSVGNGVEVNYFGSNTSCSNGTRRRRMFSTVQDAWFYSQNPLVLEQQYQEALDKNLSLYDYRHGHGFLGSSWATELNADQLLTNDRRQQPVAVFSGDTVLQQTHLYRRKTDYFASIRITGSRLSDWNRSPKMIHYKTGEKQLALLTSESRSRAITIDRRTGKPVYDLAFVQSLVPSAESISTQAALPDWTHEAVGLSLGTMGNSASGASGQSPFGLHSSLVPESPPARVLSKRPVSVWQIQYSGEKPRSHRYLDRPEYLDDFPRIINLQSRITKFLDRSEFLSILDPKIKVSLDSTGRPIYDKVVEAERLKAYEGRVGVTRTKHRPEWSKVIDHGERDV